MNTFANGERLRLSKACRSPALTWEHYGRKLFQDFIGNFPIGFYHAHFLKVLSLEQNMQTEIHLHCSVPSQQLVVKVDTNLWYCVVSCLVWFYWNSFDSFGFLSLVLYCVVCNYSFLFKILLVSIKDHLIHFDSFGFFVNNMLFDSYIMLDPFILISTLLCFVI